MEYKFQFPLMRNNITREDLDTLITYLQQDNPRLTQGEQVKAFEEEWSRWVGVKYSVFVNSGASANLLSMAILKQRFPQGGEVIVPPLTWVSDIASVLQNGFKPVFADIDPATLSMDTEWILDKITSRTRAVFLTHAQGFDGLTDRLLEELHIPLIEDVCESHGATHNGQRLGSFGWISNFSFYYAHHLSTIEGGMICTNDIRVYEQVRMLRSHGLVREVNDSYLHETWTSGHEDLNPEFIFSMPAYNVRNTEIGGVLGRSQLKRLNENVLCRTRNFARFIFNLDKNKYRTEFKLAGSSNYAFPLILRKPDRELRDRVEARMISEGVEFRRGSSGGGNQLRQPYLKYLVPEGHFRNFPETEHIHFFGYYLGNYPDMTFEEIDGLCAIVNSA